MSSHHIISTPKREGAEVMHNIWWSGERLQTDYYQHSDLIRNGVELPKTQQDALIESVSYQSNFPLLTGYIQGLLEQIEERANVFESVYVRKQSRSSDAPLELIKREASRSKRYVMAHEFRGVQNFIRMGLQEQGIKEAQLERPDMLLAAKSNWSHECSADELKRFLVNLSRNWDMNKIAGHMLDSLNEGGCFVGTEVKKVGLEAFRVGCQGQTLPYDKFYMKREFLLNREEACADQPSEPSSSEKKSDVAQQSDPSQGTRDASPDLLLEGKRSRYSGGGKTPHLGGVASQQREEGDGLVLASRLRRLGATMIDFLAPFLIIVAIVPVLTSRGYLHGFNYYTRYTIMVLMIMTIFGLLNGPLLVSNGQTIGKKALKIRIVSLDGKAASPFQLFRRYFFYLLAPFIPDIGIYVSMADVLFIFKGSKRCLHDHIAGTKVVVDQRH